MEHKEQPSEDAQPQEGASSSEPSQKKESKDAEVVPGVPIVRSNTPRPLSYEMMVSSGGQPQGFQPNGALLVPTFPAKAPSAPPLPEELGERESAEKTLQTSSDQEKSVDDTQEFLWLFEYGLEMDAAILNSPERLDGLALLYGPAVLKGYSLALGAQRIYGSTGPTIVAACPEPDMEVWGVLYRIPRRLFEKNGEEASLLDTIHAAIEPQKFFQGVQVVVYETYREREVTSITYVATDMAYQQLQFVPADPEGRDAAFMQRLAVIARKQKLPEHYVQTLQGADEAVDAAPVAVEQVEESAADAHFAGHRSLPVRTHNSSLEERALPSNALGQYTSRAAQVAGQHLSHVAEVHSSHVGQVGGPLVHPGAETSIQDEQNTEPLPTFKEHLLPAANLIPKSFMSRPAPQTQRWLVVFALYLVFILFIALTLAILQGLGLTHGVVNDKFAPLGVPWLVLMYGLLGGCISSMVTLGRLRMDNPPAFVIITWFTRPFVGVILAILSYVLLTSGIFAWSVNIGRNTALVSLVGALAGFCEGRIFFRRVW